MALLERLELALRQEDRQTVREAVAALPLELREVIVLRELEGLRIVA